MAVTTLGVFGGTFDPPHLGHVAALLAAIRSLSMDRVVVTVAGEPQLRTAAPVAPAEMRLAMAHAAFDGIAGVEVSDLELRRKGPTYTVDTVEALLEGAEVPPSVVLVLGADAAATLPTWHRAGDLAGLVRVAVVPRPGATTVLPAGFEAHEVPMEPVDLSSTEVRRALAAGADPSDLVPAGVVHILGENRLYSP